MAWGPINWNAIKTGYSPGTHIDSADPTVGTEENQLKAAMWNLYENTMKEHHIRIEAGGLEGTIDLDSDLDIGASQYDILVASGTNTITAFSTAAAGVTRKIIFNSARQLTHGAALKLYPSGNRNIQTAVGDVAIFGSRGSGNWECLAYQRADGYPLLGVIQHKWNENTNQTFTVVNNPIPWDNSPPQSGEGGQIFSLTITPKYSDSYLEFFAASYCSTYANDRIVTLALFKDSETTCRRQGKPTGHNWGRYMLHTKVDTPSTAAQTWKIRIGINSTGGGTDLWLNQDALANPKGAQILDHEFWIKEVRDAA